MEWETLRLEGSGPIRHIVLNRPGVHNAINWQLLKDLVSACLVIEESPDCRCVIVRGEGPSFSSGADLKEGIMRDGTPADIMRKAKSGARAVDTLAELTPVTIAAIHGYAIGGGACLAMACDFRIASESAQVSIREVSLGISLSWHSVPNVVHLVGPSRAKEMILFGELYPAKTLLHYGFFNQVVPDDELEKASLALAEKVVRQPPLPVQMSKATVNAVAKALDRAVCHLDEPGVAFTAGTRDAREAARTFFTDETPAWEAQ
jgi:enoyl-CoA hydratase/carnithine racemase